jgi:hypothetical protein
MCGVEVRVQMFAALRAPGAGEGGVRAPGVYDDSLAHWRGSHIEEGEVGAIA